ncbi:MAG: PKD domain-containing protein [Thermoflexales bacterium]|nr:PKD domain-containing protein [Thermoflexales bacterium]
MTNPILTVLLVICLFSGSVQPNVTAAPVARLGPAAYEPDYTHAAQVMPAANEPYAWRNVEIVGGGFVTGIIFNTKEKDLVYARTDIGGAYRRDPAAMRWIPLLDWVSWDDYNLIGVESLATDPVDPNRVYVAAGTYVQPWASNGAIFRSADRGASWQSADMPIQMGANEPGRSMGERLAVDPNDNRLLYFGSRNNGLWRSADYGASWSQVTSFPVSGTAGLGLSFVLFDPASGTAGNSSQTIYVGVAVTTTNSLYRSTDAGLTWAPVAGQPSAFMPHHGVLASNGILYLTYGDKPGPYEVTKGAVWKYNTATGDWTNISPVTSDYYGFGGLAVDASHPDTLMVSTLEQWWPDDNLYRSTDGGTSWTPLWSLGPWPTRIMSYTQYISASPYLAWGGAANPPETSPKLGWMIGDLEIDPFNSDSMLYVTGATIYGSDNLTQLDSGGNITIAVKAQGLEETAIQDLISPPTGQAHLISAIGDVGGFTHNDLTVSPPEGMSGNPIFSSGSSLDYAELAPQVVARVGVGSWSGGNKGGAYSEDTGQTWQPFATQPLTTAGAGGIAVSADGATFVWDPNDVSAHYSRDRGASWAASAGLPAAVVLASDRVNANKFYAYDKATGIFYTSTDGGASFTAGATLTNTNEGKLAAVPGREGDVWVATRTGGLWHSTDSGASFTQLEDLEEASTVGFGMAAPGQSYMAIYIAGKKDGAHGLYRSDDAGATWVRINDGQHQWGWIGQTITGDPRIYGRVYVGTNGRGIQYGDIAGYGVALAPHVDTLWGVPGEAVTCTLRVSNLSAGTDTFTVTLSGYNWATDAPASVGPLAAGAGADVPIVVHIPAGVALGTSDAVTVDVTSHGDPTKSDSATLTTTAACNPVSGADMSFTPSVPRVGELVTLAGSVMWGTAILPITYTWAFGDGGVGSGQVVTHIFPITNTLQSYPVTLTATNACGSAQAQRLVTISPWGIYLPVITK